MLFRANVRRGFMPGVFFLLVLLSGCATQTRSLLREPPEDLPRRAELASAPFFPQEKYQCGPATLAMSLHAAGIPVGPDALVSQVYVPQREGSLQVEMLAAGRRNGALSVVIPGRLEALLAEVAGGTPVVVLQNLSIPLAPLWHYALVIGYDLDRAEVILRSGLDERLVLPMTTFEHTWERGGHWAMVTLPAGRLPRTTDETTTANALVAFEKTGEPAKARKAYAAARTKWPRNLTLLMGLGNTAYAMGDRDGAVDAFCEATRQHPDAAAAHNNLAVVLNELGRFDDARRSAEQAFALGGPWREAARETLETIEAARRDGNRAR